MHVKSRRGRPSHGGECVCLTGLKGLEQVEQTVLNEVITFFKEEDTAFLKLLENTGLLRKTVVLCCQHSSSWLFVSLWAQPVFSVKTKPAMGPREEDPVVPGLVLTLL